MMRRTLKAREMHFHRAFIVGLMLWGLSMHAVPVLGLPPFPSLKSKCNCYRLGDMCPADCIGCICNPTRGGDCDIDGKLDVRCSEPPSPTPQTNPSSLVEAFDLYMQAYMVPVEGGGGRPDESLFNAAASVNLGAENQRMHALLQETVNAALDAVLGFDFTLPRIANRQCEEPASDMGPGRRGPGNIRTTPPEAADIVDAVHTGISNAIINRNLNAVVEPLTTFWNDNPDFHPFHTGRYYLHGHPEYEGIPPLDSQILALKQLLGFLLNDGQALCGNDIREEPEECDGLDSSCSEDGKVCSSDCVCVIVIP